LEEGIFLCGEKINQPRGWSWFAKYGNLINIRDDYFLTPGLIMPRRSFEKWYYHVYNRWFEKMIIFKNKYDFERFYKLIIKYLKDEKFQEIKILSYCFLPNHFHMIVDNPGVKLSKFVWNIQNAYWKYYNLKYERRWPVFEWRFKAKIIDSDEYLEQCLAYVNFNALKHNIVDNIDNYKWTSYHQIDKKKIEKYKDLVLEELEF